MPIYVLGYNINKLYLPVCFRKKLRYFVKVGYYCIMPAEKQGEEGIHGVTTSPSDSPFSSIILKSVRYTTYVVIFWVY